MKKNNFFQFLIALITLSLLNIGCNSMPEFMKLKTISEDSLLTPLPIELPVDTIQNYYVDTIGNNVITPEPHTTTSTITNNVSDCKSYWMNRIMLQKQQDINELSGRYSKTFSRSQIARMIEQSGKYSEDVFYLNEAQLCERYEKLKTVFYFKLHANDAMIIDTAGVITFIQNKRK